jgi:hypothetical protein
VKEIMLMTRKLTILLTLAAAAALAQPADPPRELNCRDRSHSDHQEYFCEMREIPAPSAGKLDIDGRTNGGIRVKAWSRETVLVRAQVQAWADTEAEARALVGQVRVTAAGGQVRSEGPGSQMSHNGWSVSYEVFVPTRTDLALKTHNGGIHVADVRGRIEFEAVNGGVTLSRLAGAVHGQTVNGGLSIELAGKRWDGEELDAQTTNGGVTMAVPDGYSARLEAGTVNGGVHVDFPVTVQGEIGRNLTLTLGAGGPMVRARTTNGGVSIRRGA